MTQQFSYEDVCAAHFAKGTISLAKTQHDTPEGIIRSITDGWNSYNKNQYANELAMLKRGKEILASGYCLIYSTPHVQLLDSHAEQLKSQGIVSPLVEIDADYIGTMQRYCYMALARAGKDANAEA